MRTRILRVVLAGGLVLAWALPTMAARRVHHTWNHNHNDIDRVTRDLSRPWPFRETTRRVRAASVRAALSQEQMESQLLDTGVLRVTNIHFVTAKADLTGDSRQVLKQIGRVLMKWHRLRVEIGGHADFRGSEQFNQKLSERRAWTVRKYLITRFPRIRGRLLAPAGYGEGQPTAPNSTTEGLSKNRRVEFTVLNQDELLRIAEMRSRRSGR